MRVLFWVQHLLGIGHLRRAQALAEALADRGAEVTILQGGFDVPGVEFPRARVVRLAPLRAADVAFSGLAGADGKPPSESLWADRAHIIRETLSSLRPGLIITEGFPFARRAFRRELVPLLESARREEPAPAIVASVRDVLVAKNDEKKERWMAETAERLYDQVIVHGDPAIIPFGRTFPFADRIDRLLFYSGYIAGSGTFGATGTETRDIIVSAGGGAVAGRLFRAVLNAVPLVAPDDLRWRFLVGPDMPQAERLDLLARARTMGRNVQVEPAVPVLAASLARARLSISQAGYNTVMDILCSGARALVVPFAAGGESEQALRAGVLAEQGRLGMLTEEQADEPPVLARAITHALGRARPDPIQWPVDGAGRSAERMLDLAREKAEA